MGYQGIWWSMGRIWMEYRWNMEGMRLHMTEYCWIMDGTRDGIRMEFSGVGVEYGWKMHGKQREYVE